MRLGGRGAERGDDVFDAVLRECHHVHVAFDHQHAIDFSDRGLRLKQAVQLAALAENRGLGRVQILGARALLAAACRVILAAENASAKANHCALLVQNRKHHAFAKTVVALAAVAGGDQSRSLQQRVVGVVVEGLSQRLPACGCPAQLKAPRHVTTDATLLEIFNRDGGRFELLLVIPRRRDHHVEQSTGLRVGLSRVVVGHGQADVLRQLRNRVGEALASVLHQKRDGRPMCAAAEAVVELLGRTD